MNDDLQLPFGRLIWESDTVFKIILQESKRRAQVEQALNGLQHLKGNVWLVPQSVSKGAEMHLTYSSPSILYPLTTAVSAWRNEPQRNLLSWFRLLEWMRGAIAASAHRYAEMLPLSPATVFLTFHEEGNVPRFKFAFIPALQPGLKDWANADPVGWQWMNQGAFFQLRDFDPAYAAAAALHYCMVGDLVPEHLPKQERFLRFLSGRTGKLPNLQGILQGLLPDTMKHEEAAALAAQMTALLQQRGHEDAKPDLAAYISAHLSALRIANRWEYEDKPALALRLWLDHEIWQGAAEVPWHRVGRLYERLQQPAQAEQSLLKGLEWKQDDSLAGAAHYLLTKARSGSKADFSALLPLIQQCDSIADSAHLELYNLQVAHLFLKYSDNPEQAARRLASECRDTWREIQRSLLLTRQHLLSTKLSAASSLCRYNIEMIDKELAPSAQSLSALTYFYLIDGIANFYAIAKMKDTSYLRDAFGLFVKAMEKAIENDDKEMTKCAGQWLIWIKKHIAYFPEELRLTVQMGIGAFLDVQRGRGIELDDTAGSTTVPWYSEYLIFEQSGKNAHLT